MSLTRIYYILKPFIPLNCRWALRRIRGWKIRRTLNDEWPVKSGTEKAPQGWPGWPGEHQFAFALSHDVEDQGGVDKVRELAELEMAEGFRSSFNFVPEGPYTVPPELREWLIENEFEVGVHDLNHDGHLYDSREGFEEKAERINQYLKEWGATGFRSGFMLHELEWLHDLDCSYDASTFDTDPFEPQPDEAGTIFPFYIRKDESEGGSGYAELPYTLPQDSTVFLLFREQSPRLWTRKLDWIAENGGMALVNVHPDYVAFNGVREPYTFSSDHYRDFLRDLKENHAGKYWAALPREIASHVTEHKNDLSKTAGEATHARVASRQRKNRPVWIDLENTPHIPLFNPIANELKRRGHDVVLSARDAYQTCEMATLYGMDYTKIGRHYGKYKLLKLWGLFCRGSQLIPFALRHRPVISLNHGSHTQTLVSKLLGIPTVTMRDYEHAQSLTLQFAKWNIVPKACAEHWEDGAKDKTLTFDGIKEDVYVPDFEPDLSLAQTMELKEGKIIVTVRPPATQAHYYNPESSELFIHLMKRLSSRDDIQTVMLPRNQEEAELRKEYPEWFADRKTIVPEGVVDGLNLIWHSDLVVSGGGTMNREAAAMGVPVYSIFRGKTCGIDRGLQEDGRLTLIESVDDVEHKIELKARCRDEAASRAEKRVLHEVVSLIEEIIDKLEEEDASLIHARSETEEVHAAH